MQIRRRSITVTVVVPEMGTQPSNQAANLGLTSARLGSLTGPGAWTQILHRLVTLFELSCCSQLGIAQACPPFEFDLTYRLHRT